MEQKMTKYEIECKLRAVEGAMMRQEMSESCWNAETVKLLELEKAKLEKMLARMPSWAVL